MDAEIAKALRTFADNVKAKVTANAAGEPEAQLSGPVSSLLESLGKINHRKIVAKPESQLGDRLGIPDFGLVVDGALTGYVELKAPHRGADTGRFTGRDKDQWNRFKAQPNILYTDGNEWCLYQNGQPTERLLRLSKDITQHGAKGVSDADAAHFRAIVTHMLSWKPQVSEKPKEQAELLAPLCRLLRDDVTEALKDTASPLVALAGEWRSLLFPNASDEQFADAYAQTVTFALLLARAEGAKVTELSSATDKLESGHILLSRALRVLTDSTVRAEIAPSLALLQRVIDAFPKGAMQPGAGQAKGNTDDPWLYFYEHFLAVYDPKLRKDSGVYYTPVDVVRCQVALVDDVLQESLGKAGGFTHKDVVTLDPAVGTGTYLLGLIDHALESVRKAQGAAALAAKATTLASNLYGFELMTGPYAVSELRLTRALRDRGARIPDAGLGVYLTDALDSPHAEPPKPPTILSPIANQHRFAVEVKDRKSVIVCIGNPPYDRHDAVEYVDGQVSEQDRARTGGWVRWGDVSLATESAVQKARGAGNRKTVYTTTVEQERGILKDFIDPAKAAGHGGDLKNLYNLYVYFWRWAIWKVFEQPPLLETGKRAAKGDNAGVVSFITASSYIRGDAFVGMREMLRRLCHEVYIIDLGGEGRGTRQDENVFNIQTPVAICMAVRTGKKDKNVPGAVKYASIHGTREEKYQKLASVKSLKSLKWKKCPTDWHAPLRPAGTGEFFTWPLLTDLMPWQSNGVQCKRTWPIACTEASLQARWKALLQAPDRGKAMKESGDRTTTLKLDMLLTRDEWPERTLPIGKLQKNAAMPPTVPYAYRSFDRQRLIADARLIARPRPGIWLAHSSKQLYLTSLFSQPLGTGPATVASADIPDLDTFRGSFGAKATFPLFRDAAAKEPNILPGLLTLWGKKLKRAITPHDFAAYVYGIMANPGFVERFWDELEDCQLRIPLTLNKKLFADVSSAGATLLHLHTYGERFQPPRTRKPQIPAGKARVKEAISDRPEDYPQTFEYIEQSKTLRIGTGAIAPVAPAIWNYEVSGLQVVKSWLGYRMKDRKGKKSSDLDDIHPERWTSEFTDELLRLLAILEDTIARQPQLDTLLAKVVDGPLLKAADLPKVPPAMRKPPRASDAGGLFDDNDEDENDE